tara:strand:+ start:704 stop:1066 length:363 start_codon:yes stop_codon:yes gene_type:complete
MTEFDPDSKKTQKGKYRTVDRETVWRLATIQCSYAEMAQVTGISEKGLKKKFGKLIDQGWDAGKKSIRRAMMEKGLNGDTRMLIWLSKQYLGHEDAPNKEGNTVPLPWSDDDLPTDKEEK